MQKKMIVIKYSAAKMIKLVTRTYLRKKNIRVLKQNHFRCDGKVTFLPLLILL